MTHYYARVCVAVAGVVVLIMSPLGVSAACVDGLLPNPSTAILFGTAGLSSSDIWAVGAHEEGGAAVIEHWDSAAWSIFPSPKLPGSALDAVSVGSTTDAWAAGIGRSGSLLEHWDGRLWTAFSQRYPYRLAAVSVAQGDPNSVWAVGSATLCGNHCVYATPFSEHWDGARWRTAKVPFTRSSAELSGVLSLRGGTAWAVGSQSNVIGDSSHPLILHAVGGAWSNVNGIDQMGVPLAIVGTSESDVWIVGIRQYGSAPLVAHWNGATWTLINIPHPRGTEPGAISEMSPTNIWIAGRFLRSQPPHGIGPYLAHFDGTAWTGNIPTPIGATLGQNNSVFSTSSGAWITGGAVLHPPSPDETGFNSFAHC